MAAIAAQPARVCGVVAGSRRLGIPPTGDPCLVHAAWSATNLRSSTILRCGPMYRLQQRGLNSGR
jgi:hypothetical protein